MVGRRVGGDSEMTGAATGGGEMGRDVSAATDGVSSFVAAVVCGDVEAIVKLPVVPIYLAVRAAVFALATVV